MNDNEKNLLNLFIYLTDSGWIKGITNNDNNVGITFENEIGKKADSLFLPDYKGIEIKCSQRYSGYPFSLFSLAFDGPNLYEMNRIVTMYGREDRIYKNRYILMGNLKCDTKVLINNNFFELKIDDDKKILYINIYDENFNLLEERPYIDFSTIKDRLEIKLNQLAIVWASKRKVSNDVYFRYYKIEILRLKSFERFIELIKENKLSISIEGRVSRSGEEEGRQRNKNIVFRLPKENVEYLFDKIYCYDHDKNKYQ
ncbi:MAG TPA: MvaI/BcnI family restriction endonuclease [Bacilli bacterium]|nr:MvaI/BcnI family restriction endonuclease [Bacilli bacterium]